jgi:hypothetical protein
MMDDNHLNASARGITNLLELVQKTREMAIREVNEGFGEMHLVMNMNEEYGEWSGARTVEMGVKNKTLKESSNNEAADMFIAALAVLFCRGLTIDELAAYGLQKLEKWKKRQDEDLPVSLERLMEIYGRPKIPIQV